MTTTKTVTPERDAIEVATKEIVEMRRILKQNIDAAIAEHGYYDHIAVLLRGERSGLKLALDTLACYVTDRTGQPLEYERPE